MASEPKPEPTAEEIAEVKKWIENLLNAYDPPADDEDVRREADAFYDSISATPEERDRAHALTRSYKLDDRSEADVSDRIILREETVIWVDFARH